MVNLGALCAIVSPFLVVSVRGDSIAASNGIDVNLDLNVGNGGKIAAAWWAGWHSDLLPLDKVSWKKYTHMNYAFA